LTRTGGFDARESPDGGELYYLRANGEVWRRPVAGGEETKVMSRPFWPTAWVLSRGGIYFMASEDRLPERRGDSTIQFFDFKSGRVTELFRDEGRGPYWLAVSPDERWLLYTKNPFWTSELMLVENFR
jgi:hypothetical protein